MRAVLALVVFWAAAGFLSIPSALAQDTKADRKAATALPSDKLLAEVVGGRMSKLFPKFGYPVDVFTSDASSNKPSVFLDYDSYGFKIRNKVVGSCMVFSDWKGTVFNATMGDSQDEIVKKLGKPKTSDKGDDGLPYMKWSFKDWDGSLEIDFDKDNKMYRAVIED